MTDARIDAVARLLAIGDYDGEDIWDGLLDHRMDALEVAESLDRDTGDDPWRWADQEVARHRLNAGVLLEAADKADEQVGVMRFERYQVENLQEQLLARERELRDMERDLNQCERERAHEHARAEGYY